MDKKLQNKLKSYSALTAAAALTATAADAQMTSRTINYTGGYETYDFDIDNDGNMDFAIVAGNWGACYGITGNLINIEAKGSNEIYVASNSWYPYVMSSGDPINSSGTFNALGYVWGGCTTYGAGPISNGVYFAGTYNGSPNWGANTGETSIVGVTFESGGYMHYGWFRLTTSADLSSWTLVDVGFDAQPMITAYAGDGSYATNYAATAVQDASNTGNASDMSITVTPDNAHEYFGNVDGYYVVIAKDDDRSWVTWADVVFGAAAGFNFPEDGSASYGPSFTAWSEDCDGDVILQGFPYKVYTVTYGDGVMRMDVQSITLNPSLGVEELENNVTVSAFDKQLNIESAKSLNNAALSVFDVTGKVVHRATVNGNNYSVNINEATGVYIVNIVTAEGLITKKVVL